MSRSSIWAGWFAFHFFLIIAVSCRDMFQALSGDVTYFPRSLEPYWQRAQLIASSLLGGELPMANPIRQALGGYTYSTGIEAGYNYFAPSVPSGCVLVFELHYPDGRVEYDLPGVSGEAAGYRLATLLDNIERLRYEPLREMLIELLTSTSWQQHPEASTIRALLGVVAQPTPAEFRAGARGSFKLLYSYNFRRCSGSAPSNTR